MTWLGDQTQRVSDTDKEKLTAKRTALVEKLKKIQAAGPAGKFAHNVRHHQEDMLDVCSEIKKLNKKLGLPLDSIN